MGRLGCAVWAPECVYMWVSVAWCLLDFKWVSIFKNSAETWKKNICVLAAGLSIDTQCSKGVNWKNPSTKSHRNHFRHDPAFNYFLHPEPGKNNIPLVFCFFATKVWSGPQLQQFDGGGGFDKISTTVVGICFHSHGAYHSFGTGITLSVLALTFRQTTYI